MGALIFIAASKRGQDIQKFAEVKGASKICICN